MLVIRNVEIPGDLLNRGVAQGRLCHPELVGIEGRMRDEFICTQVRRAGQSSISLLTCHSVLLHELASTLNPLRDLLLALMDDPGCGMLPLLCSATEIAQDNLLNWRRSQHSRSCKDGEKSRCQRPHRRCRRRCGERSSQLGNASSPRRRMPWAVRLCYPNWTSDKIR